MRTHLADFRLSVPPLPPRHVARPRLVAALNRASEVPLTLVSAGAGAGKTVLLSEWVHQSAGRMVWLTLSSVDVQPTRFWGLLARALRQADALPLVDTMELAGFPAHALPVAASSAAGHPGNAPARVT